MCLIVFANRVVPGYELVLIANRDEFLKRPTDSLDWWADQPDILAGRDRVGGGTWLGINRSGEWTAITNYREPLPDIPQAPSRGKLAKDLLEKNLTLLSGNFIERTTPEAYHGFNLLSGDQSGIGYFSNRSSELPKALEPGFYGLSNHLLDTAWPKVERTKAAFENAVGQGRVDFLELFELLGDEKQANEEELPFTGVPKNWERVLSSAYINAEEFGYGTRLRTILTISNSGQVRMCEWARGEENPRQEFLFQRR